MVLVAVSFKKSCIIKILLTIEALKRDGIYPVHVNLFQMEANPNFSPPEKMTKGLGCNSSVYTTGVKKYSSVVYTGG